MMKVKPHVLIVDDEPMILESVSDLLEFEYVVHKTNDPREALRILSDLSLPIKIVMSDQRMPGMFGHELLRQAKSIRPNAVRLLLTGYSDLEAVMYSVNVGEIFRYINKPWKSDKLLNVFKLAVQLHDQMSELAGPAPSGHSSADTSSKESVQAASKNEPPKTESSENASTILFVGYSDWVMNQIPESIGRKFKIIYAPTIDEAFRLLPAEQVSVLVSEISFPQCDGIDFLKAVKQQYPHIVTVILTDVVDAQLAIRAINELNVFKYLAMPVEMTELEKVLERAAATCSAYKAEPTKNLFYTASQTEPDKKDESSSMSNLRQRLKAAQEALFRNPR